MELKQQQLFTLVNEFIKSKTNAWAESTIRSEKHRLRVMVASVEHIYIDAPALWNSLADRKPYTRATCWTRAITFVDWLIKNQYIPGPNKLKDWREANAKQFKNIYTRHTPDIGYDEAMDRIGQIQDSGIRAKCVQLLEGGLRYTESYTIANGKIRGKGGKERRVYVEACEYAGSYSAVYKALKEIGLKPHMLRKIKATQLARRGARPEQLCEIMGWSNYNTGQSYINAGTDKELEALMIGKI